LRTDYLLKRVRELFKGAAGSGGAKPAGAERSGNDIGRLVDKVRNRTPAAVMAGCVHVLGLGEIRARVGDGSTAMADRATAIADAVLREYLAPEDVYQLVGDAAFQICFETQDEAYASFQVQRISGQIEQRIRLELQDATMVSVNGFAAPVDNRSFTEAADPLAALYAKLLEIRDQVSDRAAKRQGMVAHRYASALFQPLWPRRASGKTINRSMLDSAAGVAASEHLTALEDRDELIEALAKLDCVLFAKSVEGLHQALGDVKQASVMVPVQFHTLLYGPSEFTDLGAALPPPYRKFLLLDVLGVPTTATPADVLQAVSACRQITERVVLQLSPVDYRLNDGIRAAIWGLSVSVSEVDSESPQVTVELGTFGRLVRGAGLFSFVYGVNTIGKAEAAFDAGFDYIGGSAVHSTVPAPRSHARFAPLFGDRRPKAAIGSDRPELRAHPRFVPLEPQSVITLPEGQQHRCRVLNVSASGAVVLSDVVVAVGDYLALGAMGAQVVRLSSGGFAAQFLEIQPTSALETALQMSVQPELLTALKALSGKTE
jgi:hypothetical protein